MKSIKEKAEEYSFIRQGIDPVGIQFREFNIDKQEGFEAGANYVLEQIEKLTNNQNWCAFPKQSHKELEELIEQLKK